MKPQIIQQLEKYLNTEFKKVDINKMFHVKWTEYPHYSSDKKGLITGIHIEGFNLKEIPNELIKHSYIYDSLIHLNLQDNDLKDISSLKKFTNLKYLNLKINNISDISVLKNLNQITYLNLHSNQIKNIEPLEYLIQLRTLFLWSNNITDILPLKNLKSLRVLELIDNPINRLSKWICEFPNMEIQWSAQWSENFITFNDNPIENPPIEIIKQGKDAIKNYFAELEKGKVNLYETKLLLVGYGAVGKTSLMKRLLYNEYNENEVSTEGIDIKRWDLKTKNNNELKINIWDFGGQEIYHSTHQFFLSKRSIYLLVWDARIDKMMPNLASFDYWLRIVSLLSQNSPILVIQNKIDERASLVAEKYLKDYFPNIVGFYKVSAKEKIGIEELTKVISKEIIKLPHIGEQLPKVWIDIRDNLKQTQQNFIKLDDYIVICKTYGIDIEQALHLSNYFHDLGVFLHFQDNDILRNIIFLNPDWATKAVYKIIDTKEVVLNQGKFNYSQLRNIWKDYPDDKFSFLIELMKKFELCFLLPNQTDYIVPGMLPPNHPDSVDNWDNKDNLQFEFRYKFMPAGIITRLIVRMHDYIKSNLFWSQGVVIERKQAIALITSNTFERFISIKIKGKNRQDLFSIIKYEIENIHKTLKDPIVKLMTHCICNECIDGEFPEFYAFEQLNKYLDKGKTTVTCPKSVEEVSINKLLGKINGNGKQKSLFDYILFALKQLQGLSLNIQKYEDSRNSFIANVLTNKNFRVKDQTKWGKARVQPGEIDIKIEDESGETIAIYEAFNLKDFTKSVIKSHITKIFDYDANGLPENYMVVYCNKNFTENWNKYINYIPTIEYKHELTGFTDISNNYDIPTNIKIGIAKHKRNEKQVKIYHFFVELQTID